MENFFAEFLETATQLVLRDFNFVHSLDLLRACLAFTAYNSLTKELADKIFCDAFMVKVEKEMEMIMGSSEYPYAVQRTLMQVNRAVCLAYPEFQVPWFHDKFAQQNSIRLVVVGSIVSKKK